MKIAVDVGYSSVKAVSEHGKVIFPSVVAPAAEDLLGGAIKGSAKYHVQIHRENGAEEYLVGEAALMSTAATGFLALREKPDGVHDVLLLTATYLLTCQEGMMAPIHIGIGLPLAYYKTQRVALKGRLEGITAWVKTEFSDCIERCLRYTSVSVFPQGAGALMTAGELPKSGLVALLDIGSYTTDYLVFELIQGQPVPVTECCGSVEAGVSLVTRAIADEFQRQTGALLPTRMQETTLTKVLGGEQVTYNGRQVELGKALAASRAQVGGLVASSVAAVLRDRVGFVTQTYLAGGGAAMFEQEISQVLPCVGAVTDPVYANARGFLKMLSPEP